VGPAIGGGFAVRFSAPYYMAETPKTAVFTKAAVQGLGFFEA
jgi:hypothetical protein